MPVAWSSRIFFVTLVMILKGGNIYKVEQSQVRLKASIAVASGSGCQLTYLSICLLILLAKRSISGVYAISQIFLNKRGFSIHSVLSWKTLENLSAVVFCLPGMKAAEIQKIFDIA